MSLVLDILLAQTYNAKTIVIVDNSNYPINFNIISPTIDITIPGIGLVTLPFVPNNYNVFNSSNLGLTQPNEPLVDLPDGEWKFRYSVFPNTQNFVQKSFMRIDKLQERFDKAFLTLEMTQCDMAIKNQYKMELDSVYFMIQGVIASGNNCMTEVANKLYLAALKALNKFVKCSC